MGFHERFNSDRPNNSTSKTSTTLKTTSQKLIFQHMGPQLTKRAALSRLKTNADEVTTQQKRIENSKLHNESFLHKELHHEQVQ